MYIFQSNLYNHSSFFIFHVNKTNELTSISYCDGNKIDEERKITNSATHINGVTTFHLKTPIGYDNDFAKNFINENSKNKSIEDFYKKFKEKTITIEGVEIDYTKTTHSIPTKIQKRGNCAFKSPSLAARFILETIDPTMEFGFDEASQKPTGAGYLKYKEFKDGLTKSALDFIMKMKEKISSKLDSSSDYLREEIKDVMTMVARKSNKKLSNDHQPRQEFHKEMNRESFSSLGYTFQARVSRDKTPKQKSACFSFVARYFSNSSKDTPRQR